jgi:hypothetical protein
MLKNCAVSITGVIGVQFNGQNVRTKVTFPLSKCECITLWINKLCISFCISIDVEFRFHLVQHTPFLLALTYFKHFMNTPRIIHKGHIHIDNIHKVVEVKKRENNNIKKGERPPSQTI